MDQDLNKLTNEELWQLFPIIISDPQPDWKEKYLAEEKRITQLVGETIVRIHHISSTAVPGLLAKPTIDMLAEIKEETNIEWLIKTIEDAGYIYSPQPNNPPPHISFMKGYTIHGFKGQCYHLHIRYPGDWDEIYFRDYLINHPEEADKYAHLKLSLAQKYKHDRNQYTDAKTDFIKRCTVIARNKTKK